MVNIPVAQAITGALNANISNAAGVNGDPRDIRTPWVFSSRLRKLTNFERSEISATDPRAPDLDFLGPGVSAPELTMLINPNSVTFDQPKRWLKKDVRNGSVFFHFTNHKGQNNDVLTLRFKGNTGNIDLRGDLVEPKVGTTQALAKLRAWHNLYLLTREPILLSDNSVNVQSITLSSQLLPLPVTFRGFYNKVLDFEESAAKPNSKDYSFEFTVTGTDPDLDTVITDVLAVLDNPTTPSNATNASTLFGSNFTSAGGQDARFIPRVQIGE